MLGINCFLWFHQLKINKLNNEMHKENMGAHKHIEDFMKEIKNFIDRQHKYNKVVQNRLFPDQKK